MKPALFPLFNIHVKKRVRVDINQRLAIVIRRFGPFKNATAFANSNVGKLYWIT